MPVLVFGKDSYIDLRSRSPKPPACPACGIILHPFGHTFSGKAKPRYDLSATIEDMCLISPRMKEFLDRHCTSPLLYFETGGGYFVLRPERAVYLDLSEASVDHSAMCRTCGELNGVYGRALKPRMLPGQPPVGSMDLVRSQQRFGTLRQCQPVLIAGDRLAEELKAERMTGVVFVA